MSSLFKHILASAGTSSAPVTPSKSTSKNSRRKSEVVSTASSKLIVAMKKTDEETIESNDTVALSSSPSLKNRRHSVPEPIIHIEEASSLDTIEEVLQN